MGDIERYSRQEMIPSWDQNKLKDVAISIVGKGKLADFLIIDLLAMGIGRVDRVGQSDYLEFSKINSNCNFSQTDLGEIGNESLADSYIGSPDFIVDASNNARQKLVISRYSRRNNIPFISSASTSSGLWFSLSGLESRLLEDSAHYSGSEQGKINSMVCAALTADEIRKRLFKLKYDITAEHLECRDIVEDQERLTGRRVAIVGAGAAGTFAGLALAGEEAEVDIIDFDVVEESNLNRQFLFYDAIGDFKADSLAKRLSKYGQFRGVRMKIDENFDPRQYDTVVSCLDNFKGRKILNKLAAKYGVPLVNCGVSLYEGEVMGYVPGKTACLDCQMFGALSREDESNSGRRGCITQPSFIMPNQIAGTLAGYEVKEIKEGNPRIYRFGLGQGVFLALPENKCLPTCLKND